MANGRSQLRVAKADLDDRRFGVWLTTEQAARYCGFGDCQHPGDAFRQFAKRVGLVPSGRAGDSPRYTRRDLDAAMSPQHQETR